MSTNEDMPTRLNIAIATVSNSRTENNDSSGDFLSQAVVAAGHQVSERCCIADNRYQIRAVVSKWIVNSAIQVVLINGGTGFYQTNSTPEALLPLFDRVIEGFGELFRMLSWQEIGSAALQSRALAGIVNHTLIFAIPGSTSACHTAWQHIISAQLQQSTRPCNFITHLKYHENI